MNIFPSILAAGLATFAFTACGDNGPDPTATTLSADAHFVAVFAPYGSPEECIVSSNDPRGCRFALTFCTDGRAARRIADIVSIGEYEMTGNVAHASYEDGTSLTFDMTTMKASDDSPTTSWIRDVNNLHRTPQFDTINCAN